MQVYGRLWFRCYQPRPDLRPPPQLCTLDNTWQPSARRKPSMTASGCFVFLNESGQLNELGWDGPQRNKLWRYNQHYFDDLNALETPARQSWHSTLIEDWLACNPPAKGTGWEPYPLSLRMVNWIKWSLSGSTLSSNAVHSLAIQARWLEKRLEIHLLGNHLFSNAKALVFAGLFFQGKEADGWLDKGLKILAREVPEQILPDGGHFERSSMYHALAFEDMLDLINITSTFASRLNPSQQAQVSNWKALATTMHTWLQSMCHPDGEISFFNDAAFDIACNPEELTVYAQRLLPALNSPAEQTVQHLENSGYIRLTQGRAVALLDTAPVGPDYLPGHAHADTLSFELSLGQQRVLVNSGTSCYGDSDERLRQRGTSAHNTVTIDQHDSSEVWGGFRVARRAYPVNLRIEDQPDKSLTQVGCSHNGYHWLAGKPVHYRQWHMNNIGLTVEDQVGGSYGSAVARFHFHPDLQIETRADAQSGKTLLPDGSTMTWHVEHGEARIEPATWHPRFGISTPSQCLTIKLRQGRSRLKLVWSDSQA